MRPAWILLAASLFAAGSAAASCTFQKVADLPVKLRGSQLLVDASIGGYRFEMLVDTGASITMIDGAVAKAANLNPAATATSSAWVARDVQAGLWWTTSSSPAQRFPAGGFW